MDREARRRANVASLVRAAIATYIRKNWPDDFAAAKPVTRGPTTPESIGSVDAGLAQVVVRDFIASLRPVSAAARLFGMGRRIGI